MMSGGSVIKRIKPRFPTLELTPEEIWRFREIEPTLLEETGTRLTARDELDLPVVAKTLRITGLSCRATKKPIVYGTECLAFYPVFVRRVPPVFALLGREIFEMLLEAGSFRNLRVFLRTQREEARRKSRRSGIRL